MTAINVDAENLYYSSRDGVLFDKDKTNLIEYPYGKTTESYTVPATVSEIGAWAFFGNKTLRTIDLNQAIMVRKYAFAECSNLTAISADKIKYAEIGVVEETPWLNNKTNDFIMLGGALLEYRGSAKAVSLETAVSISPYSEETLRTEKSMCPAISTTNTKKTLFGSNTLPLSPCTGRRSNLTATGGRVRRRQCGVSWICRRASCPRERRI